MSLNLGRAGVLARPRYGGTGTPRDAPLIQVRRGFPAKVALKTDDFLTHAPSLFASHPITEVVLGDRRAINPDSHIPGSRVIGWRRERRPPVYRAHLPADLWLLLTAGEPDGDWRWYWTEKDALADLSLACVAYGRGKAKLPPLQPAG